MWLLDNLIDDHRLAEARQWLEKLEALDDTFRTVMYRYMIAQAAGEKEESEKLLCQLETMEGQEWCWAVTLGDIYTLRQEYDKAIEWYRKGQEMQPSPNSLTALPALHISARSAATVPAQSRHTGKSCVCSRMNGVLSAENCAKKLNGQSSDCHDTIAA